MWAMIELFMPHAVLDQAASNAFLLYALEGGGRPANFQ